MDIFEEKMRRAAEEAGYALAEDKIGQFCRYHDLIIAWNEKMNLTAITDPGEVAAKHMIDSLNAYDARFFPPAARVIDVGSGAGFPGIPLKILRPDIRLTLLDSLQKRLDFLRAVIRELRLSDVSCVHARAEDAAHDRHYRERFDIAVARAVARLPVLMEYTLPFLAKGGHFLALKGAQYREEMAEAENAARILGGGAMEARETVIPGFADRHAVIAVEKLRATPRAYPRRAGLPAKEPL